jgi:hypothetical protein
MSGFAILTLVLAAAAGADAAPSAYAGNGALSVALDAGGRVVSVQWPRPGEHDQVRNPAGSAGDAAGLTWGVDAGNGLRWLHTEPAQVQWLVDGAAPMVETVHRFSGIEATQTVFVFPTLDLLVCRVEVAGAQAPPRFVFRAAWAPCTRALPALPVACWALDYANAFAAFTEPSAGIAHVFAPRAANAAAWQRAARLVSDGASPADWDGFEPGVWIAVAAADGVDRLGIGPAAESGYAPDAPLPQAAMSPSCVYIEPRAGGESGRWSATVYAGLAARRAGAVRIVEKGRGLSYAQLRELTRTHWQGYFDQTPLPAFLPLHERRQAQRAVGLLAIARDRAGGGIVFAPGTAPPQGLVLPRDAGWITLALDRVGRHEVSAGHLRFLASALRDTELPGAPHGSVPAALYATGVPAAPAAMLDVDAVGWILAACRRHGEQLGARARRAFYTSVWDGVTRGAEFLASWCDPLTGAVLPSWQPGRMRDGVSPETMLAAFMGLLAAESIAAEMNEPPSPEWRQRRRGLEAAIQLDFHRRAAPWPMPGELAWWLADAVPADHWLRRPMRVGDAAWTPLGDARFPVWDYLGLSRGTEPFTDARAAALYLAALFEARGG